MQKEQQLSKKELRALEFQQKMDKKLKEERNKKFIIAGIIAFAVVIIGAGIWWAAAQSSKPLPGTAVADLGREHIQDISKIKYNSNPPTSGSHFPMWAKRGVYPYPISDGYLIHSLEHGYIVISYNCEPQAIKQPAAPILTQMKMDKTGAMSPFTPATKPAQEVKLSKNFETAQCKEMVSQLSKFLDEFERVVIVPRPWMDTPVALTAWDRIQKLTIADATAIREFISSFHNKGPEITTD